MNSKISSSTAEKNREQYVDELIKSVQEDFKKRREERLNYERQWELNMNFISGNQYCGINGRGEIQGEDCTFFWQNRGVFNHIAPIVESRLAKFSRVVPEVAVRPKTDDDKDVAAASVSEKLVSDVFKRSNIEEIVKKITTWCETCGTGFYKIVWNNHGGEKIGSLDGENVYEGNAEILPISPFEIFPDSLYTEDLKDCKSIIHARAVAVKDVKECYGVDVAGEDIGVYNLAKNSPTHFGDKAEGVISDAVVVIERYEAPCLKYPNGRLVTVASDKLLYVGELPYINGENGVRTFPFVKQESSRVAGSFFGASVVERLIPIQRAFNAVKNRKHEFLNRLSMGIMTVEDGSVDVDDLAEDGLSPGKVLVYRQGSKAPEIMKETTMPNEFSEEEDKLINEFVIVSGVSDVASSSANASVSSGTALEILVEQDNSRLVMVADSIRRSYVEIAKQVIRLFAQFTAGVRAVKYRDHYNRTKILYTEDGIIGSDDVYLESENELLYTTSQKKDMIFKLYDSGLLTDENGKLRPSTKEKILGLLGYKELDYQKGLARLQEERAQSENETLKIKEVKVEEIDEHSIHVDEHTRYVLSEYEELTDEQKERLYAHLRAHKEKLNEKKEGIENARTNL